MNELAVYDRWYRPVCHCTVAELVEYGVSVEAIFDAIEGNGTVRGTFLYIEPLLGFVDFMNRIEPRIYFYGGMESQEVCEITGLSRSCVFKIIKKFRDSFKESLNRMEAQYAIDCQKHRQTV